MQNVLINHITNYLDQIKELKTYDTGMEPNYWFDKEIKAVVFDIYGTLLVSGINIFNKPTISADKLRIALKEGGFTLNNNSFSEEIMALFKSNVQKQLNLFNQNGHPFPEADVVRVWRDSIDEALTHKWIEASGPVNIKALAVVFEVLNNKVWPMPGMIELLKKLRKRKLPLGIVSNAQFYTPILMNYFIDGTITKKEIIRGFNEDISIFSYKIFRSKPDIMLFEQLAASFKNNYGLEPFQVLYIGNDMLNDIYTASQMNFKTALYAGDKQSLQMHSDDERCKNCKPGFIITELKQVLSILGIK